MRLLNIDMWNKIFSPLMGLRVGYIRGEYGNVGDTLQEKALYEIGKELNLNLVWLGPSRDLPWSWDKKTGRWNGKLNHDVEHLLLFGGGNMGLEGGSQNLRKKATQLNLPMTLLPNSWRNYEKLLNCRHFAREQKSVDLYAPYARLAPDIGLSLSFSDELRSRKNIVNDIGIFLRNDTEGQFNHLKIGNKGAPFSHVDKKDVDGYLRLASSYKIIITDALHFAVAGIMADRKVYLVPGKYHKNKSMFETWLKDLGCLLVDDPREAMTI